MEWLKNNKWWAIIGGAALLVAVASASPSSTPAAVVQPLVEVSQQQAPSVETTAAPTATRQSAQNQSATDLSNDNYYTNSAGNTVHSPAYTNDSSVPAGASAQCRDGSYSFSQSRSGTCSHHGGVSQWL